MHIYISNGELDSVVQEDDEAGLRASGLKVPSYKYRTTMLLPPRMSSRGT
jgi:hypothetical protein